MVPDTKMLNNDNTNRGAPNQSTLGGVGKSSQANGRQKSLLLNGRQNESEKIATTICGSVMVSSSECQPIKSTTKSPAPKYGSVRHLTTILALSSIIMANMNRQAYNQALVRMIKKHPTETNHTPPITTTQLPLVYETNISSNNLPKDQQFTTNNPIESQTDQLLKPLVTNATNSLESFDAETGDQRQLSQEINKSSDHNVDGEGFDWSVSQISLLQAGFSYGYMIFMIPGGRLSEIYGPKWVIFLSGFGSALCSIATPFLANKSFGLLVASRIFMGICQTGVSPALYSFCSLWLPADESSVYLPMIKVSVMVGFMFGSLINSFVPWRPMFYIVGLVGFIWSVLWVSLASSEPSSNKFISSKELAFIKNCLDQQARLASNEKKNSSNIKKEYDESEDDESYSKDKFNRQESAMETDDKSSTSAPWWGIITNPVVLAYTFTKFTVKLSTDSQTMQIPMYLRNVFQVSDSLNGFLNGTNFAIQASLTGIVAYIAKEMIVRKTFGLSKTNVRTMFQGISNFGMASAYLLISFSMGSFEIVCCAVIVLSVASMFGAGGEAVLPVDLTNEYSASIMAIANSIANASGVVLPQMVSFFLANELTNSQHWSHVWWCISALMVSGGLVFVTFVEAKYQNFEPKAKRDRALVTQIKSSSSSGQKHPLAISSHAIDMTPTDHTTRL